MQRPLAATAQEPLADFLVNLAASTAAPGGGAAAAVAGAMGAALVSMVAGLTAGREKYAAAEAVMQSLLAQTRQLLPHLCDLADQDQAAFNRVMAAYKLPKATPEEKQLRKAAIGEGLKEATRVPLATMAHAVQVQELAVAAAGSGNPNALSDGWTGYLLAQAAFEAALRNVAINLGGIVEPDFRQTVLVQVAELRRRQAAAGTAMAAGPDPIKELK